MRFERIVTASGLLGREEAIALFGVTYVHGGASTNDVVEMLGRFGSDPDPVSDRRCFARRDEVVAHVRNLAREEAEREIARIDEVISTPSAKTKLWMAQNWQRVRRKELGIVATEAVLAEVRRKHKGIVKGGYDPRIRTLSDVLRFPRLLDVDTAVWVLDLTRFPDEKVALREDRVSGRSIVRVHEHPLFDYVLRYDLVGTPGKFGLDTDDEYADRMNGMDDGVRVFVTEEAGQREVRRLAVNVRMALGAGDGDGGASMSVGGLSPPMGVIGAPGRDIAALLPSPTLPVPEEPGVVPVAGIEAPVAPIPVGTPVVPVVRVESPIFGEEAPVVRVEALDMNVEAPEVRVTDEPDGDISERVLMAIAQELSIHDLLVHRLPSTLPAPPTPAEDPVALREIVPDEVKVPEESPGRSDHMDVDEMGEGENGAEGIHEHVDDEPLFAKDVSDPAEEAAEDTDDPDQATAQERSFRVLGTPLQVEEGELVDVGGKDPDEVSAEDVDEPSGSEGQGTHVLDTSHGRDDLGHVVEVDEEPATAIAPTAEPADLVEEPMAPVPDDARMMPAEPSSATSAERERFPGLAALADGRMADVLALGADDVETIEDGHDAEVGTTDSKPVIVASEARTDDPLPQPGAVSEASDERQGLPAVMTEADRAPPPTKGTALVRSSGPDEIVLFDHAERDVVDDRKFVHLEAFFQRRVRLIRPSSIAAEDSLSERVIDWLRSTGADREAG